MENLTDEKIEALKGAIERIKGVKREFGNFAAHIDEELNIHVMTRHGWEIIYPKGNEVWMYLLYWIDKWDEDAKGAIEAFFMGIVFPTAVRLGDIDEEYMRDIVSAHNNQTLRNTSNGVPKYDEEDDEGENGDGSADEGDE